DFMSRVWQASPEELFDGAPPIWQDYSPGADSEPEPAPAMVGDLNEGPVDGGLDILPGSPEWPIDWVTPEMERPLTCWVSPDGSIEGYVDSVVVQASRDPFGFARAATAHDVGDLFDEPGRVRVVQSTGLRGAPGGTRDDDGTALGVVR